MKIISSPFLLDRWSVFANPANGNRTPKHLHPYRILLCVYVTVRGGKLDFFTDDWFAACPVILAASGCLFFAFYPFRNLWWKSRLESPPPIKICSYPLKTEQDQCLKVVPCILRVIPTEIHRSITGNRLPQDTNLLARLFFEKP
jgi:hypothetical protein